MREPRPYRPALDPGAAEAALLEEAANGRLDQQAVDAVLAAGDLLGASRI
jgi:HD-GYP domain-containing protein (c-di-GMP phosphodiesterase class II)